MSSLTGLALNHLSCLYYAALRPRCVAYKVGGTYTRGWIIGTNQDWVTEGNPNFSLEDSSRANISSRSSQFSFSIFSANSLQQQQQSLQQAPPKPKNFSHPCSSLKNIFNFSAQRSNNTMASRPLQQSWMWAKYIASSLEECCTTTLCWKVIRKMQSSADRA